MYMYQNAFLYNRVGYAAAIATVLAIAIFLLAAVVLRIGDRGEHQ
jgi:ABC-type sugar transport system permease subunit